MQHQGSHEGILYHRGHGRQSKQLLLAIASSSFIYQHFLLIAYHCFALFRVRYLSLFLVFPLSEVRYCMQLLHRLI